MNKTALIKIGASLGVLGLTATLLVGALGGWTSSDSSNQSVQVGVVNLGLGTGSFTSALGTSESPAAPGDSASRYITLTNSTDNALPLKDIVAYVTIGSIVDNYPTTATASDFASDVYVVIDRCSVAWVSGACSGSTTSVLASSYLSDLDTSPEAVQLLATLSVDSIAYLKFVVTLDDQASISEPVEGASALFTWTFNASPRDAINNL